LALTGWLVPVAGFASDADGPASDPDGPAESTGAARSLSFEGVAGALLATLPADAAATGVFFASLGLWERRLAAQGDPSPHGRAERRAALTAAAAGAALSAPLQAWGAGWFRPVAGGLRSAALASHGVQAAAGAWPRR